jgi:uncharacterized membrane protein
VNKSENTSEEHSAPEGERMFLPDDPVADLETGDSFGHLAYSEALADLVTRADPPLTVGVFGAWGVGKTSICKDHLRKALAARSALAGSPDGIAYVYFDVWKYEDDSLRRQLLRELALQLESAKQLKPDYKANEQLRDLVEDTTSAKELGLKWSWRNLLVGVIWFFVFFGVAIGFVFLLEALSARDIDAGTKVTLSVFVGLLAAATQELRKTLVVQHGQITRKSLTGAEMFEHKFVDLMDRVTASRLVIVIDNIDRCSPNRVEQVLTTIKTFLQPAHSAKQPIFVIPCDKDAIRDHLRAAMSSGDPDEYLRKFFNSFMSIPMILEDQITAYAERQLARTSLGRSIGPEQLRELGVCRAITLGWSLRR